MLINVPVSVGELFDKITILKIKAARLSDAGQLENVRRELGELERVAACVPASPELDALVERLQAVNDGLWDVEDGKRAHEREGRFDADFVALARRVYKENDQRAAIKRDINRLTGSTLVEEKSHGG
ncbi:DUF6165 family protein [Roseibacterium beibuensis]|uniref:DUF6165 family protein n=1 Tax=[Roseibacterium] beibuensis TaxID=1193142 RepID=UPI00217E3984|nr:DUF6165 family protein [Roseibacterium beibuensis]MCS6622660.1 DUF6165 family protein [Roseibacterium beibuensis]